MGIISLKQGVRLPFLNLGLGERGGRHNMNRFSFKKIAAESNAVVWIDSARDSCSLPSAAGPSEDRICPLLLSPRPCPITSSSPEPAFCASFLPPCSAAGGCHVQLPGFLPRQLFPLPIAFSLLCRLIQITFFLVHSPCSRHFFSSPHRCVQA